MNMKRKIFYLFFIIIIESVSSQNILPNYNGIWTNPDLNPQGWEISVLDLMPFYQDKLDILRNEIYARYGRPFSNPKYREYFTSQSWYVEKQNYSDSWLTAEDKKLIELIVSIEKPPCYDVISDAKKNNIVFIGTFCDLLFPQFTFQNAVFRWHKDASFTNTEVIENCLWIVIGEWLITYDQMYDWGKASDYQLHYYRIKSNTREVDDKKGLRRTVIKKDIWEKYLSEQEKIKIIYTRNW